jgi:hypothetical protein
MYLILKINWKVDPSIINLQTFNTPTIQLATTSSVLFPLSVFVLSNSILTDAVPRDTSESKSSAKP